MAINTSMTDQIEDVRRQQRAYKTAQSRQASTIHSYSKDVSVSVSAGSSVAIWMDGNPDTMMASCYLPNISATSLLGVYIRPVYNGNCGFRIYSYANALNTVARVVANQEISLHVE